jgi:tripeptide aminopeptidase
LGLDVLEDQAAGALGGSTGNLLVRLRPTISSGVPLFFCAHLDTVPEEGQIHPVVEDGVVRSEGDTILGADNKAALAVLLEAVRRVLEEGRPHAGIELLFTPMEEVGCKGAKLFDERLLKARIGYVYDHAGPIGDYVRSAPSGYLLFLDFHGRAAHAGIAPEEGRSAIQAAARTVAQLSLGRLDNRATVNVGVIAGGTAHNVVADQCSFSVDIRARAQAEAMDIVEHVLNTASTTAVASDCIVEHNLEEKYREYSFGGSEQVLRLAETALAATGRTLNPIDAGGGADASIFNARGMSCLNLANGMARIHSSDEHVSIEDLGRMVDVTLGLIDAATSERVKA